MDLLMHNPIADMYGPYFLLLYGAVIAVTFLACWWVLRSRDWTASLPTPPVPPSPDAYEIAYLRGGENEVVRSVIFSLVQRGYLQINQQGKEPSIERAPEPPDRHQLPTLERRVFDWFSTPHTAGEVFRSSGLPEQIKSFCATYEQRLHRENLLMPAEMRTAAIQVWMAGALVIIALGGYKLFVALAKGRHNVAFLVVMAIVSLLLLIKICHLPRLSSKGRAYLRNLQLAFERLKARTAGATAAPAVNSAAAVDPSLLLLVGVFGVAALSGTPYDYYQQTFRRAAAGGGSCGSSSCSSSGGDGGGGGCGGGGCGGCGG